MRASRSLTDLEIAAFTKFAHDYDIIIDDGVGVRNADILCGPIINSDSDITTQTLAASFLNVRTQLALKSSTYKKADALAGKLSPEEQEIYRVWAKNQRLLIGIDGSPEGYQNVLSLLSWFRGNSVTSHNLDLALGNIINNPQVGQRIHFHPQPKQQDRSVVQGRPTHAWGQEEPKPKAAAAGVQGQEFVNGRRNHAYVPPEGAQKKVAAAVPDSWREIVQIQLRDWTVPSQQTRLENEYKAGVAAGRTNREISESLAILIKDQHRGR
jgi:hypothetical protein